MTWARGRADHPRIQTHHLEVTHAQTEIKQVWSAVGVLLAGEELGLLG